MNLRGSRPRRKKKKERREPIKPLCIGEEKGGSTELLFVSLIGRKSSVPAAGPRNREEKKRKKREKKEGPGNSLLSS